jgi:hypothetical protein
MCFQIILWLVYFGSIIKRLQLRDLGATMLSSYLKDYLIFFLHEQDEFTIEHIN